MSRVLINGQDVNYTSDFPQMTYDKWKEIPEDLRPNYCEITDRDYTGEPLDNSVSVTADGVKTYSTLLNELYALIDMNRIGRNSSVVRTMASGEKQVFRVTVITENLIVATYSYTASTTQASPQNSIHIKASRSSFYSYLLSGTVSDVSSTVPASGTALTLYYNIVASPGVGDIAADDVSYGSGTVKDALDDVTEQITVEEVSTGINGVTAYKCGKLVCLVFKCPTLSGSGNEYHTIGNLPSALCPKIEMKFLGLDNSITTETVTMLPVQMKITTGGEMSWFSFDDQHQCAPNGTITYFTN